MTKSNPEIAVEYFNSGFNCSQSVLATFCENYKMDKETALKISCGLGAGCRSGEICGAASGAILVIGLANGQCDANDKQSKSDCYAKTVDFLNRFRDSNQSIVCRELLGCDISTDEGMERAQREGLFGTTCVAMVKSAAEILDNSGY